MLDNPYKDYVAHIPRTHMLNKSYDLIVLPMSLGTYHILLRRHNVVKSLTEEKGVVVIDRTLVTTKINCVWWALHRLATTADPYQYTMTYERDNNVDPSTNNINLDNL